MLYLKIYLGKSFITTPLPLLTSISFLIGLVFLSIGTITNLLENITGSINKKKKYNIIQKITFSNTKNFFSIKRSLVFLYLNNSKTFENSKLLSSYT